MQFGKVRRGGQDVVVMVENGLVSALDMTRDPAVKTLADLLHSPDAEKTAGELADTTTTADRFADTTFRAPIDGQEVWAAGVTYKRSKIAREEESVGAAQFYDKVYRRAAGATTASPGRCGPASASTARRRRRWSRRRPGATR